MLKQQLSTKNGNNLVQYLNPTYFLQIGHSTLWKLFEQRIAQPSFPGFLSYVFFLFRIHAPEDSTAFTGDTGSPWLSHIPSSSGRFGHLGNDDFYHVKVREEIFSSIKWNKKRIYINYQQLY